VNVKNEIPTGNQMELFKGTFVFVSKREIIGSNSKLKYLVAAKKTRLVMIPTLRITTDLNLKINFPSSQLNEIDASKIGRDLISHNE
jgi:hypothetical protein